MQASNSWLLIERADGNIDKVQTSSLSFDGGSLICFADEAQTKVKAAYSPVGWAHVRWCSHDEIPAQ